MDEEEALPHLLLISGEMVDEDGPVATVQVTYKSNLPWDEETISKLMDILVLSHIKAGVTLNEIRHSTI